ncbi:MAG: ABC transporter ATP-binding protein [Deltaproteobacteria bacterium]|nr:ABC transporter ATP-binding protein [Deltaproteobacteria bacterium]
MSEQNATPSGASVGETFVRLRNVSKIYQRGAEKLRVLDNIDLEIKAGAFEALMGPSGSGKTTLLNLIAGLDRPTDGTVEVGDTKLSALREGRLAKWRARHVGFVFQSFNLLPVLTAEQNVALPLLLTSLSSAERKKRALTALKVVGLSDRTNHFPRQLSGGQEQRVSIARAIVNDPDIIVADEPTGDLDRQSADEILDLLQKLNQEFNKTVLMVTHDPVAAERASLTRRLDKGSLQ